MSDDDDDNKDVSGGGHINSVLDSTFSPALSFRTQKHQHTPAQTNTEQNANSSIKLKALQQQQQLHTEHYHITRHTANDFNLNRNLNFRT